MSSDGYVVYDCDIGTDDAWGLLMLIKGEQMHSNLIKPPKLTINTTTKTSAASTIHALKKRRSYKILGVTCVHGNTDVNNVAKNALRLLDSVDRNDIPVYRGCSLPIIPTNGQLKCHYHGVDGFGDLEYERSIDVEQIQQQHAVNAMYEFACKYPKLIDFILVGPLTNFAMCIKMYGDDFLNKVRNIYIMGGNYRGKGNVTKSAEFNFMMDPEAAYIVLHHAKTPLTILPWETCLEGDFGTTLDWRMKVLGSVKSKAMQLLNRVESAILIPKGFIKWIVCDAMLVAAYIFPYMAISESRLYHATVELIGSHTRGQMVIDHLGNNENNILAITAIHRDNYKNIIAWTAGVAEQQ